MNDILFGNNNKAVIKKLANRSFRSNKMRNVIAVIAIALTTFLFTAVLTIGMGAKGTLELQQKTASAKRSHNKKYLSRRSPDLPEPPHQPTI